MKIVLPKWVYKNLDKFGNCALPNVCNEMNKRDLEKHLSKVMGVKVEVRVAHFKDEKNDYAPLKKETINDYLVAEEKR